MARFFKCDKCKLKVKSEKCKRIYISAGDSGYSMPMIFDLNLCRNCFEDVIEVIDSLVEIE